MSRETKRKAKRAKNKDFVSRFFSRLSLAWAGLFQTTEESKDDGI